MSTLATLATVRRSWDADAGAYIKAVEVADGQQLEPAVAQAINQFVLGCKADGVWTPIKASCILMGARTLSGILTPLVGSAPTNINFVTGDYNRKTGLKGSHASGKYLGSNRSNSADGQNDHHVAVYLSSLPSAWQNNFDMLFGNNSASAGTRVYAYPTTIRPYGTNRGSSTIELRNTAIATGFLGVSRGASASYTFRMSGSSTTITQTSNAPGSGDIQIFAATGYTVRYGGEMTFYSIGGSVDLSLLDSRVSALYTAIGNALT